MNHEDHLIGSFSTLAVFSLPGAVMDGIYKVLAAILTAMLASAASALVKRWLRPRGPKL
jgi:hypothetical protein